MDYLELLPETAKTLKQSIKAIYHQNGKLEEIDLSYSKISQLLQNRHDIIFSHSLLDGESLMLKNTAEFLVVNNSFFTFHRLRKLEMKLTGKSLQIGSPLVDATFTVSNIRASFYIDDVIEAVFPLPFRDSSFDNVVVSEVLDYDIIKEASRLLKRTGKAYLIINAFRGVRPVEAIRAFSIKFITTFAKEQNGFWIIEGVKKD